ncbi:MAG TPA: CBS domain-containing protein [Kofleriaceae bacterium]|nr:CBS domain-containing protein [Kofleriaceae bacterium]
MKIAEIMSQRVHVTGPDLDAEAAWRCMQQLHVHHLVVVEGEKVVGLLSERDLGGRRGERMREGRRVREMMTPDPIVLDPATEVRAAAELLRGLSLGCFPVVAGCELVGIITAGDLLDLIAGNRQPVP